MEDETKNEVRTVNVNSLWWRIMDILLCKSCHQILANNTVKCPSFVTSCNFLPHSSQETLRIEKSSHPKYLQLHVELTPIIFPNFVYMT